MAAEIRLATADDVEALAETHIASWQVAYAGQLPQELLDELDPRDRIPGWIQALSQPPPTAVYVAGSVPATDAGPPANNGSTSH